MLFNIKAAILLGLVAISAAAPTSLEARAKGKALPDAVECKAPTGTVTFTKSQINAARNAGKELALAKPTRKYRGGYPKDFGNMNGKTKIFAADKGSTWYEYPILQGGGTFRGIGDQKSFRVIFKANGDYVGLTYHKGDPSYACTTVTTAAGPSKTDDDKKKEDEEKKKKEDEEAKKKADEDAKKKADEDAKKKADEDAKKKADEDAKKKADEDAKKKADEDAKKKADEDAKKKADEDAKKKADEDAKKKKKTSGGKKTGGGKKKTTH